jgi:hypothetical protein
MTFMDTIVGNPSMLPCAGSRIRKAIRLAERHEQPFRHWLPGGVLPAPMARGLADLGLSPPGIDDTLGKRETHNASRLFVNEAVRRRFPVCASLADSFQDEATVGLLADMTGADLEGGYLRIEYCLDTDGFWLEPHTDIGAKLLTFLVYLSDHPDADGWGTDLMTARGDVVGQAPGGFGKGLIFVPADDTWHGFVRRPIRGVRCSLIVNYVKPEWRSRHELAFPEQPVTAI